MKSLFTLLLLSFISSGLYAQEICDNAIDDDGDGLIDLNDDECDCDGFAGYVESLIPNPSFEDTLCCPAEEASLFCAETWIQASTPTTDYYHICDFTVRDPWAMVVEADLALPGGGEAWVGYWNYPGWQEYTGACLLSDMTAGVEYTLNFYTAWGKGFADTEIVIFGSPDCTDLPWVGTDCPIGYGSFVELGRTSVTHVMDGSWQEVTIVFTPAVDITAVAIGGSCDATGSENYYYLDALTLLDSDSFSDIGVIEDETVCDEIILEATTDTTGGTWQWYLEGIAIVGETGPTIDASIYGTGEYSAIYTIDLTCQRSNFTVFDPDITANFEFTNVCVGDSVHFTNTSVFADGADPGWDWDFTDGGVSDEENPVHLFTESGSYLVELIGVNELGCNDTVVIAVDVEPFPEPNFEFVIGGVTSADITGGCVENAVQFNDLSIIDAPGTIVAWSWDFGDVSTSDEENPEHMYGAAGTYTVTLTVTSENGCEATYSMDIIMTESLTLELIYNNPTCFGYSDGSVTVNVTGGGGEYTFVITDSDDEVLNIANSNTANELSTGWYYIDVSDITACEGIDSVFLTEPGEIDIDLTTFDVECYDFKTGWAEVVDVINYTGSYDGISYFWNPNPNEIDGLGANTSTDLGAGNYTVTINDENGCSNIFDFEILEPTELVVDIDFNPALCRTFGYQNGNGVVYGTAEGGTPDYDYLWTNLDNGDEYINTTVGGLNPGNFEFTVTDGNGCVTVGTVFLDSINPVAAFTVNSAQLNADCQGTADVVVEFINESYDFALEDDPTSDTTFFWNLNSPNNSYEITHSYEYRPDTTYFAEGQTYQIEVCLIAFNKNDCQDEACKIITVYEPIKFNNVNVFSPNGDGKNDIFTFEFKAASISQFECVIVNRWGVVVAELLSITDGWDGTDRNGDQVKDGTYFYTYKAITDDNSELTGQGTVNVVGGSSK